MAAAGKKTRRVARGGRGVSQSRCWPGLASFLGLGRCRVLVVLPVVGLCVVLLGASGAAGSLGRPAVAHRTAGMRVVWRGCGSRLQCARVRVPLDWAHPGGRKISLAVIRYLAATRTGGLARCSLTQAARATPGLTSCGREVASSWMASARAGLTWSAGIPGARMPALPSAALETSPAGQGSGAGSRSPPRTRTRAVTVARLMRLRDAAANLAARCCATSQTSSRCVTSTICAVWSAIGNSTSTACRGAPSSARPTPTCSHAGCARWSSMGSSTRCHS